MRLRRFSQCPPPAERSPAAREAVRRAAGGPPQEVEAAVRRLIFAWHVDWARRVLRRLGLLLGTLLTLDAAPALPQETRLLHDAAGAIGPLTAPRAGRPVPAVILVHDSLGIDARADRTVAQLLEAGIAALEIELYAVSADGADGAAAFDPAAEAAVLARARQALLAAPGIDGSRLAALGFGRGAHAVALAPGGAGPAPDWAARVLLYPACAAVAHALPAGPGASGAPVLVMHGDSGAGDPPRDCLRLASRFEDAGAPARVIHYRGASHGWDAPPVRGDAPSRHPDPGSEGRGGEGRGGDGRVGIVPWPELAAMSAAQAVGFLAGALLTR
jgi:dienelactone hydrolase